MLEAVPLADLAVLEDAPAEGLAANLAAFPRREDGVRQLTIVVAGHSEQAVAVRPDVLRRGDGDGAEHVRAPGQVVSVVVEHLDATDPVGDGPVEGGPIDLFEVVPVLVPDLG